MPDLDPAIVARAFQSASGELAWKRGDVHAALDAMERAELAVLGWEAWGVKDGKIWASLPLLENDREGFFGGSTNAVEIGQAWGDYCRRTVARTHAQIDDRPTVEECIPPGWISRVHYNISYISQHE